MKYIGENAIKKLISLIKGDLATKQPTITASGLLKGDGAGTVTAADTQEATLVDVPNGLLKGDGTTISQAVAGTDYVVPSTALNELPGHIANGDIHVTAEQKAAWNGKAAKALSFTVTLTVAGWSGNAQTVSNSNFAVSGYAYTVCPAGDSFAGYAEAVIYADDVTTAGKMTFHCNEAPTANLTVNILRTEATA